MVHRAVSGLHEAVEQQVRVIERLLEAPAAPPASSKLASSAGAARAREAKR
jgi:hypothetical protein